MIFRVLSIFALFLRLEARNFEYQLSPIRHLKMLEQKPKIQEILKRLETTETQWNVKPKLRRMHGIVTKIADFPKPNSLVISSGVEERKSPPISLETFEQELAQQIENEEMKFVEDEKNPMKYVVENGILYKKSRYSPLARLEIPPIPGMKIRQPPKAVKPKIIEKLRTSVFRGNINRQMAAIPISTAFAINNSPKSFAIKNEMHNSKNDAKCYINQFGYKCCNSSLESLILKSFDKLKRKEANPSISKISDYLKKVSRRVFAKPFEAIVGFSDFDATIPVENSCKLSLGRENLVVWVFVPNFPSDRTQLLQYHELTREDIRQPVDLVVSKNGILVTKEHDDYDY